MFPAHPQIFARACLKIAFCWVYATIYGRFISVKSSHISSVDWIWYKYTTKCGVQTVRMNFQTRPNNIIEIFIKKSNNYIIFILFPGSLDNTFKKLEHSIKNIPAW